MSGLITYVAEAVPFDNADNFYDAENVKAALIENDFRELLRAPTGLENRNSTTISFDDVTRTFTIAPIGAEFFYRILGKRFIVSGSASVQIPDISGIWTFFVDNAGALTAVQGGHFYGETNRTTIATVYWSSTDQEAIFLLDNRHEIYMPWSTQERLEEAERATPSFRAFNPDDYIVNGDGSLDAHMTFSITGGRLYDTDLVHLITDSPTPAAQGEQTLSPAARIPMFYKSGATGEWRKLTATDYPLALNGAGNPFYNEWTGSTWQLTAMPDNFYASSVIFVTNNRLEPVIGIVPQFIATNAIDATKEVIQTLNLEGFTDIINEWYPLVLGVYEAASSFLNTPKARFVAISDPLGLEAQVDRYTILATYNGNANNGRYLEVIPGTASDASPFYFPEDSYIRTVTLQTQQNTTVSVGFFALTDLVTPRLEVTMTSASNAVFDVSTLFNANEELAVRITGGNSNTPAVRFWVQTTVGT